MPTTPSPEPCPRCGERNTVRPKLLLIDEAWRPAPGKEARERYFSDLRVDDVKTGALRAHPLQQFVDGHYCDRCGRGFVSESIVEPTRVSYQ